MGDSRFSASFRPVEGGTLFSCFYEEPPPDWNSAAITRMALRYTKSPETMAAIMRLVKDYVENPQAVESGQ